MANLKSILTTILIACLAGGCTLGPEYQAPEISQPKKFRAAHGGDSIADQSWQKVFADPILQRLIKEGLENSPDLVAATYRIEEARAAAGIARSEFFPFIRGNFQAERERISRGSVDGSVFPATLQNDFRLGGLLSYEIDLWGRIRRSNEAARAELLAATYQQAFVRNTLIASIAAAYVELRTADAQLSIAKETLKLRQQALQLMRERADGGAISELEYNQAKVLVNEAELAIPRAKIDIATSENLICLLLGSPPREISRGRPLAQLEPKIAVKAGLPSSLLTRRPDILSAEQELIARNADIGAARALMFPTLSLTGSAGFRSTELDQLVRAPNRNFSAGTDLLTPIFAAGRFQMLTAAATARREQALANYQLTIQRAFQESADALVTQQQATQILNAQNRLVESLDEVARLARIRFEEGATDYLQVLDAERNLFAGQIAQTEAQRLRTLSIISAFRALGGGWK